MSDAAIGNDLALSSQVRARHEATVKVGGLYPTVLIDGDADTASFTTGKPIPAIPTVDVPSTGQRVLVEFGTERGRPTGHVWIVGVIGGMQRTLGTFGTEAAQTGIGAEEDLTLTAGGDRLEVESRLVHPNRVVVVHGHVRVEQASGSPAPILRAYAEDSDGDVHALGICAESPVLGAGENVVLEGEATWSRWNPACGSASPDPGELTFYLSIACPSGTVDTLASASVASGTWLRAEDGGADL